MSTAHWDQLLELPLAGKSRRISTRFRMQAGEVRPITLAGTGCIRHWWLTYMYKAAEDAGELDLMTAIHQVRLQIFFDGSDTPAVDQPLDTFFGTLLDLPPVEIDSAPITVLKRNAFNSWFPMPFQTGFEIRLTNGNPRPLVIYFIGDVRMYPADTRLTPLRFRADYRKLDPAPDYAFMEMANLSGRGFVAGLFHGTDARSQTDSWYHTGGDTWLLDGETAEPGVIRGNGGEDLVGYSFGTFRSQHPWQGCPWVDAEDGAAKGRTPSIFYRFFGPDALCFETSAIAKFGTKDARIETTLFAYTDNRPTPMRGRTIADWQLCAPFDARTWEAFTRAEFPESEPPSDRTFTTDLPAWQPNPRALAPLPPYTGRWVAETSRRGWIDFLDHFKGINFANSNICGEGGAAYALGYHESGEAGPATLRIAFDDWLALWVNDVFIGHYRHDHGFGVESIPVRLVAGRNSVLVKLSNAVNEDFLCWAFHLAID